MRVTGGELAVILGFLVLLVSVVEWILEPSFVWFCVGLLSLAVALLEVDLSDIEMEVKEQRGLE